MAEDGETQRLLGKLEEGQRAAQQQRSTLFERLDVVEDDTAAQGEQIKALGDRVSGVSEQIKELAEKVAGIKGMPSVFYSRWLYVVVGIGMLLLTGALTWDEVIQMLRGWVGAPQ